MRVFASLPVPADLASALTPGLPALPEGVRAIPQDRWHLTLAFYGELEQAGIACVEGRLQRRLARLAEGPLTVGVVGGGVFSGGVGYLRVAGSQPADDARMEALARGSYRAGKACQAPGAVAGYRFRAHITVARGKRSAPLPPDVREALRGVRSPPWSVPALHLVSSHLGPQPRYEILRAFPLAAHRDPECGAAGRS
jgi:2'-5' RNA ligase